MRWNSLVEAITRALTLRPTIECLLNLSKYDKAGQQGLRRYKLSQDEWLVLVQLHDLLKI